MMIPVSNVEIGIHIQKAIINRTERALTGALFFAQYFQSFIVPEPVRSVITHMKKGEATNPSPTLKNFKL